MTDGRLFLGLTSAICLAAFLVGLRFRRGWWMPQDADPRFRLLGLLMMAAAPLFFLFFAALCFGLLGPVDGIALIRFQ